MLVARDTTRNCNAFRAQFMNAPMALCKSKRCCVEVFYSFRKVVFDLKFLLSYYTDSIKNYNIR